MISLLRLHSLLPTRLFQIPSAPERARNLAQREFVDALAHPRRGWILGGRDVAMVPLIVLDEEVTIADHGQNDLGHPAVEGFLLVAKFVPSVQGQTVDDAQGQGEHDNFPPSHRLGRHPPCRDDQRGIMHGDGKIGENSIVSVRLETRHRRFRRIIRIVSEQDVQGRNNAIPDHQREGVKDAPSCQTDKVKADQWRCRPDDRQHP